MKFTKYAPWGARVVLKLDSPEQVTEGGIIIPDSHQRPSTTAVVVSVGNQCEKAKEKMHVIIPKDVAENAQELEINKEKYILVLEQMIDGEVE